MLHWIVLVVLIIVEVAGFTWWLRREFYPVMFNGWAALIYSAIFAADCLIAWLVSMLDTPGGTLGTAWLAVCGVSFMVIAALSSLFVRWIVKQDLGEPPPD